MSSNSLPLDQWPAGIPQASVPANQNALRLEAFLRPCLGVANDETGSDVDGDVWLVGDTPAGAFAAFAEHDIALARVDDDGTSWHGFTPFTGARLVVNSVRKVFNGSAWIDDPSVTGGGGGSDVVAVATPANSSGTVTLDFASKSKYVGAITLAANVTTLALSNLPGAGNYAEYELHIAQDGTGSHTFAIPASHKALGGSDTAIASAANAVTVLTASTVDNGTTWRYAMQESA
jgi:hypothetical protein